MLIVESQRATLPTMNVLGLSGAPPPPGFFLILPFYVAGVWLLACVITSYTDGWHKLAQRFRATEPFSGATWNFQSGRMGIANYGSALTVGANFHGLYLRPMLLVRFAHPPLFIPWQEITAQRKRMWIFGEYVMLRLGRGIETSFLIDTRLAERLRAEAQDGWPSKPNIG